MKIKTLVLSLMLVASVLCAGKASAEGLDIEGLDGEVTAGGAFTDLDNESSKYGEYTGIEDNEFHFVGEADLDYEWDSHFIGFDARDLGLENRRLRLDIGKYGSYDFFLGFEQTPHLINNNARTPFANAGDRSDTLTLDSGITAGADTSSITGLASNLHDIELRLERKTASAGFSKDLGYGLDFAVTVSTEQKEGTKSIGAVFGTNGSGSNRSVILPEPVDYKTNELRASVGYRAEKANARFEYYLSSFDNEVESLTWDNVYTAGSFATTGRLALPPDNRYQRFSLTGGVSLPHRTRVSAVAEYGRMEQDEDLLDYSVNGESPVRTSADAEITTTNLTLNAATRPFARLGVNARYRYYKTENDTPRDIFNKVSNDDTGGQVGVASSQAARNLPFDYSQNKVDVDASYYLARATTVKAGYTYDAVSRDFREVEETVENEVRAAVNSGYIENTSIGASYSYSYRDIDGEYDADRIFRELHTSAYINVADSGSPCDFTDPDNPCFDNHRDLRKFDIADRARNTFGANLTVFPSEMFTLGAYANYYKDEYDNSTFGLTESGATSYTVDVTASPTEFATVHLFYTRDEMDYKQNGRSFRGFNKVVESQQPSRNWTAEHEDEVDTIGVGARLGFMYDRLTIDGNYTFVQSNSTIRFSTGGFATPTDMPELTTWRNTLELITRYRLTSNIGLGAGYKFENYKSENWSTRGIPPGSATLTRLLTLAGSVPDYEAHQGMVFVTYYFGADDMYFY